jgi:hypothetical protein
MLPPFFYFLILSREFGDNKAEIKKAMAKSPTWELLYFLLLLLSIVVACVGLAIDILIDQMANGKLPFLLPEFCFHRKQMVV